MGKYPLEGLRGKAVADLAWLKGEWRGNHGEDIVEESWSALGANSLMAMFRWQRSNAVFFYEFIVIEMSDDLIYMRLKHFYPALKGWEEKDVATEFLLVSLSENEAVFLQLNKANAPWLIYRLKDANTLLVYFETEEKSPTEEEIFNYQRI